MKRSFYYLESEKTIEDILVYVQEYEDEGLIQHYIDYSNCIIVINDLEIEDIEDLYDLLDIDGLIEDFDYEDDIDDHSFDDFHNDDDDDDL